MGCVSGHTEKGGVVHAQSRPCSWLLLQRRFVNFGVLRAGGLGVVILTSPEEAAYILSELVPEDMGYAEGSGDPLALFSRRYELTAFEEASICGVSCCCK